MREPGDGGLDYVQRHAPRTVGVPSLLSRIDIRRAGRRIVYDTLWLDDGDGSIGERLGR
jgi:hypothetical protein